jgi:hypothetical protein
MKEVIFYGQLNQANRLFIQEKAKAKKDGVYQARWISYRVRDGRVTHYVVRGEVLENFGGFVTPVGTFDDNAAALKALKAFKG